MIEVAACQPIQRLDAECLLDCAPCERRIVGPEERALITFAVGIDHGRVERDGHPILGLQEGSPTLADDRVEQERQEAQCYHDGGQAIGPESSLGGIAPTHARVIAASE